MSARQISSPHPNLACLLGNNVRSILSDYRNLGEEIWQRFVTRKEGMLWYYRSVLDVLIQAGRMPLVDELGRVVSELERLARQVPDS